ncbi:MAG: hypothetical protein AB9915_01595 [Candidatus Dojkabacteria bacterium]
MSGSITTAFPFDVSLLQEEPSPRGMSPREIEIWKGGLTYIHSDSTAPRINMGEGWEEFKVYLTAALRDQEGLILLLGCKSFLFRSRIEFNPAIGPEMGLLATFSTIETEDPEMTYKRFIGGLKEYLIKYFEYLKK